MNPYFLFLIATGSVALVAKLLSSNDSVSTKHRIFISHSWDRGDEEYKKLIAKLDNSGVEYYNHSIPEEKALDINGRKQLREAFTRKMRGCNKVFIMANSGIPSNGFVAMEVQIAKELKKEIVAVKPIGQKSMPTFIRNAANLVVSNKVDSILKTLQE